MSGITLITRRSLRRLRNRIKSRTTVLAALSMVNLCLVSPSIASACGTAPSLVDYPAFFGADTENHFTSAGQLFVIPSTSTYFYWNFLTKPHDLDICVRLRAVDVSDGGYAGIVFWYKSDDRFSVFDMTPDGSFYVDRWEKDHWNTIARPTLPANLIQAGIPPKLEVQTQGTLATFLVNDVVVGSIVGDKLSSAGRDGGLYTFSGPKRPIYAFSDLSVTALENSAADGKPQNGLVIGGTPPTQKLPDVAPEEVTPAPVLSLVEPFLSMYVGLENDGLGKVLPAGYTTTSTTSNYGPDRGKAEQRFKLSGDGLECEIIFRFYGSKSDADSYYMSADNPQYIVEAHQLGGSLSFGKQHVASLDTDLPVVTGVIPDAHKEISRVIGSTDALVVIATVERTKPEIGTGTSVDTNLTALAGEFVSKGLVAAKLAAIAMIQRGDTAKPETLPDQPR